MAKTDGATKHQLAPTVRGAFIRALGLVHDNHNLTFSELVYQAMLDDEGEVSPERVLSVMDRVSKYKENVSVGSVTHDGSIKHEGLPSVDSFLQEHVESATGIDSEVSRPH